MAIAGSGVTPQPAAAHNTGSSFTYWRNLYNDGRQCTQVAANGNHGPPSSQTSNYLLTMSYRGDCSTALAQSGGSVQHRGSIYANGGLCVHGGWQPSSGNTHFVEWADPNNISTAYCGGRTGWLTHDITSVVWNPWVGAWNVSEARPWPTTGHSY